MILDELTVYLSQIGLGTPGTTLFAGYLPDSPDVTTALYEYAGMPLEYVAEYKGVAYDQPRVQVVNRGLPQDYLGARTAAQAVWDRFSAVQNQVVDGIWYVSIVPLSSPFRLRRDELQRDLIACNYQIHKAVS